jgi:hypothetical protein
MRQYVVSLPQLDTVDDFRSQGILARKVLSIFHGVANTQDLAPLGAYELLEARSHLAELQGRGLIEISFPVEPIDPSDATSHPVFLVSLSRLEEFEHDAEDLVLYDVD